MTIYTADNIWCIHEMNDKLTLGMFNVPPPDVPLVVYSDVWCNVLALLMYI